MSATLKISVVVCTHDRAPLLASALESLAGQSFPVADREVIVVDNGSSARARAAAKAVVLRFPDARYVGEPRLGLSHARNRGLREARGELIAFLDDDARADGHWLESVVAAFDAHPEAACLGGPVRPDWETEAPRWITPELMSYLAILDCGPEVRALTADEWLAGANIAFRRSKLDEIGGFDPALGRRGKRLLSMEEIVVLRELQERGETVLYVPQASVVHWVPAARLRRRWFLARAFWQGVSDAIVTVGRDGVSRRSGLANLFSEARRVGTDRSGGLFRKLCGAAHRTGYYLRLLSGRKPRAQATGMPGSQNSRF